MKIAVATEGGSVSAHFGRCPSYTLVEVRDGRIVSREEIPNPGHEPGFLPRYLSERGVDVIIAGGMGPRAQALFAERNIQSLTGVQGTVEEVLDKFLGQELEAGEDLCDHKDHGDDGHGHIHGDSAAGSSPERLPEGKILVSAAGPTLDADIVPNFGRSPYFLIVDPATLQCDSLANPHAEASHGAGIRAARWAAGREVAAVLTGQVGPHARRVLDAAGIAVLAAGEGTVRQAIARLKGN
ncbi:MAG: hypothetical protein JW747_06140 [Candidatus Aminicenantes bacterium]|nr:hypothetical protein [Candidatus Aminicenantes bacterium]